MTVVLFVKRRVVATYAFRHGELTDARVDEVVKGLLALFDAKK